MASAQAAMCIWRDLLLSQIGDPKLSDEKVASVRFALGLPGADQL